MKFIEVSPINEKPKLINTRHIESIDDMGDYRIIYMAFNCPDSTEQDYLKVTNSFDYFRKLLCDSIHSY